MPERVDSKAPPFRYRLLEALAGHWQSASRRPPPAEVDPDAAFWTRVVDALAGDWARREPFEGYSPSVARTAGGPARQKAAARPEKAIDYGWRARRADRAHGRHDGRIGLPPAETGRFTTPYLEHLIRHTLDLVELERLYLEADNSDLRIRLASISAEQTALREALSVASERLRILRQPPSAADLRQRRPGEAAAADGIVHQRRLREHTRRVAATEAAFNVTYQQLANSEARATAIREQMWHRHLQAAIAAKRLQELALRRISAYLEALLRTHPQGPRLSALIPLSKELERGLGGHLFTYDHVEWEQQLHREYTYGPVAD